MIASWCVAPVEPLSEAPTDDEIAAAFLRAYGRAPEAGEDAASLVWADYQHDPSRYACGEPATAERLVDGMLCPLCGGHATELDGGVA